MCVLGGLQAQVDLKLNVGRALFGGYGLNGEFGLNDNSSLSLEVAYANNDFNSDSLGFRNVRVIPEYRYYFAPQAGTDRFFVGGYGKLANAKTRAEGESTKAVTRGVLGIMAGHKWVTDGGFLFELNAGVGRGLVFSRPRRRPPRMVPSRRSTRAWGW